MPTFSDNESGSSVRTKINTAITTVDGLGSGDNLLMTAAERSKLAGVEASATADQSGAEIVSAIDTQLGGSTWQGGGSAIEVEDEGVSLTTDVTKFNFVGSGVTVTEPVADEVTVTIAGGAAPVDSVNTQTGAVVLDADDIDDTSTTNKFATAAQLAKVDNISEVSDPAADAIAFFDFSAGDMVYFTSMTGLSISGTTLSVSVDTAQIVDDAVTIAKINATGTPGSGNFLRGDGQWVAPAGGGDLLAANNLSDLANAGTARTNLGLGTAATTASTAYATSAQGDVAETEVVTVCLFEAGEDTATGNKAGNQVFRVPAKLNGWNLTGVAAYVDTAGTTGTTDVQIHNITDTADMLTTVITIDSAETDSSTAATAAVIDAANDDVATGDKIRFDVDAVSTTAAQGLWVEMTFEAP